MQPDNLKAFVAVAETGSFSRAAEQLYLTQPAVSKRVAGLESELGASLFDRIGHQISLTEAGQALLPRAHQLLLDIEDSRRAIRNLSGEISGTLNLATSHHIGLHRLPPVLKSYTRQYPGVKLDIDFTDSENACQAVQHGDLELAIVTLPLQPPGDLVTEQVWLDPLVVVVAKHHPLTRTEKPGLKQLVSHPAVLPAHGTFTRSLVEQALGKQAANLNASLETNYLETLGMLTSVGLGWSVLPENMVSDDMTIINIPGLVMTRTLGSVHHRERTLSNAARALLAELRQHADPADRGAT